MCSANSKKIEPEIELRRRNVIVSTACDSNPSGSAIDSGARNKLPTQRQPSLKTCADFGSDSLDVDIGTEQGQKPLKCFAISNDDFFPAACYAVR